LTWSFSGMAQVGGACPGGMAPGVPPRGWQGSQSKLSIVPAGGRDHKGRSRHPLSRGMAPPKPPARHPQDGGTGKIASRLPARRRIPSRTRRTTARAIRCGGAEASKWDPFNRELWYPVRSCNRREPYCTETLSHAAQYAALLRGLKSVPFVSDLVTSPTPVIPR
jgi:hypothetical protein